MSVSQHPIALRLERQVGEGTRLLGTVMGLPLVDGIFPALILAGAVSGPVGIMEVGLLVFGGSATLAVVLAEMEGSRRDRIGSILAVGALLLPIAAVEAALAPTVQNLIDLAVFQRFAALVILAIAAKTASATIGEYLPSPGVIVGLGLIGSANPAALSTRSIEFVADPTLILSGVAAAGVGVAFALLVAVAAPWLHGNVALDRFRFGSAVALGVLALSVLEVPFVPSNTPVALAVLLVTSLLAFDPAPVETSDDAASTQAAGASPDGGAPEGPPAAAEPPTDIAAEGAADGEDAEESAATGIPGLSDGDREPWL